MVTAAEPWRPLPIFALLVLNYLNPAADNTNRVSHMPWLTMRNQ